MNKKTKYFENARIVLPKRFILDCMRNKQINMIHVYIAQLICSREHYNITSKELRDILKSKFSTQHISMLLKQWREQPFIHYDIENDTYRIERNVESYFGDIYDEYGIEGGLKFNYKDLNYTGNTLTRFL